MNDQTYRINDDGLTVAQKQDIQYLIAERALILTDERLTRAEWEASIDEFDKPRIEVIGVQVHNDGGVYSWSMDYASVGPPPDALGKYALFRLSGDNEQYGVSTCEHCGQPYSAGTASRHRAIVDAALGEEEQ